MKEFKMRFKDYIFPSNPQSIKITTQSKTAQSGIYGGQSTVQSVCVNPTIISGSGIFAGEGAQEECRRLSHMLKINTSGEFHCPNAQPIKAYLTEFSYSAAADRGALAYSFEFTEDCNGRREEIEFDYTLALDGENAFDIAARTGVTVDEVVELNSLKGPFDITAGERILLK